MKFAVLLVIIIASCSLSNAQDNILNTGNEFVQANVLGESGQFAIMKANGDPLSYSGINQWNSYTTFYIHATGNDFWYTTQSQKFKNNNPGMAGSRSKYVKADSTIKIADTIRTVWGNSNTNTLNAFVVIQDLYPIKTTGGGQIMIKYTVSSKSNSSGNTFKGIFLMLDIAVQVPPTGTGDPDVCSAETDKPLVLTSLSYDAYSTGGDLGGVCWTGQEHYYTDKTGMPDFFLAGRRFPDYGGGTTLLGKGNLTGPGLTPPNEFYVYDWNDFIDTTWDFDSSWINGSGQTKTYLDAAVGYKWNTTLGGSTVPKVFATAYGMNDYDQQYNICQGTKPILLLASVSPRHHYRGPDGNFDSLNTIVKVWAVNADHQRRVANPDNITIDLSAAPHFLTPSSMTLPAIIAGTTSNALSQSAVGVATWNLVLDTNKVRSQDSIDEVISFHNVAGNNSNLNCDCSSLVTTTYHPAAPDLVPPVVAVESSTRYQTLWMLSDSRNGDTGLNSMTITDSTNYDILKRPDFALQPCDTSYHPEVYVKVHDTTKNARFVFQIQDCSSNGGNVTIDSATFTAKKVAVDERLSLPELFTISSYPNPFYDATDVVVEGPAGMLLSGAKVFSAVGADVTAIANVAVSNFVDSRRFKINGANLAPGMYTVVAATTRGTLRQTIMLMR